MKVFIDDSFTDLYFIYEFLIFYWPKEFLLFYFLSGLCSHFKQFEFLLGDVVFSGPGILTENLDDSSLFEGDEYMISDGIKSCLLIGRSSNIFIFSSSLIGSSFELF